MPKGKPKTGVTKKTDNQIASRTFERAKAAGITRSGAHMDEVQRNIAKRVGTVYLPQDPRHAKVAFEEIDKVVSKQEKAIKDRKQEEKNMRDEREYKHPKPRDRRAAALKAANTRRRNKGK